MARSTSGGCFVEPSRTKRNRYVFFYYSTINSNIAGGYLQIYEEKAKAMLAYRDFIMSGELRVHLHLQILMVYPQRFHKLGGDIISTRLVYIPPTPTINFTCSVLSSKAHNSWHQCSQQTNSSSIYHTNTCISTALDPCHLCGQFYIISSHPIYYIPSAYMSCRMCAQLTSRHLYTHLSVHRLP